MDWEQLRTILWLRWRLTRNQWRRDGGWGAVITALVLFFATIITLAASVGGFCGGYFGLAHAPPEVAVLVWDILVGVFLFFWAIGVLTEIQRSETIDIGRLLHLPISLRDVFVVNFVVSHFSLSIILFVPGMLALVLGHALGQSTRMLLLAPAVVGFVFMVTAWTYCLRGWLVALMVNKRRRRAILAALGLTLVLVGQLPNLYFNVFRTRDHKSAKPRGAPRQNSSPLSLTPQIETAHRYIPPLWLANGALGLARGTAWPALAGATAAAILGALGLMRAYRSTIRFYQGAETQKLAKAIVVSPRTPANRASAKFLERAIPGVPEEAAALALVNFRSLLRAPEVKMALASPLIMALVFGSMVLARNSGANAAWFQPFLASGIVAVSLFGMMQLLCNQFGFDRDGFRALVLLPTPRRFLLLGKNLSVAPFALGSGAFLLVVAVLVSKISLLDLVLGGMQLITGFLLTALYGNVFSIVAPYRLNAG
ncbi:MAG: hypothetical protein HY043_03465, partial [Verrucomicrobia bacterium]|nr:hypothetical protein [Verrucomicrobiota bacterium]